jgi:hypothetical protein
VISAAAAHFLLNDIVNEWQKTREDGWMGEEIPCCDGRMILGKRGLKVTF